ncbi:MAG: SMP-30/gluconolactonase/LRE family protein, partial [Salinigranum sp.]
MRLTRRAAVMAAGAGLALPALGRAAAAATRANVETVVEIPGERTPENLAIDPRGAVYFGITAGAVWRIDPEQTRRTGLTLDDLTRVATLPGTVIGVEVVPDGALYVASQSEQGTGVWRVPRDGGDPAPFATTSGGGDVFFNDVLYDGGYDRLLVSESYGGVVYEVPLDDGDRPELSVWSDSDLFDTESFGANGITRAADGAVYVAVTRAPGQTGRLLRVPLGADGAAGAPTTFFDGPELFGADGVTARDGDVYVAANSQNRVVRVTPDGSTTAVATADDGLVFPSDVLFGSGEL